jgi:O-antigen ligase
VSNNPEHSTVHNYFLLLALEQGLIGLLLFLALLTGMFISLQRLYIQLQSNFYKTITLTIACLLTILVVVNLMSDLIETDKVGAVFYTSLAAILLLKQQLQQEKNALT